MASVEEPHKDILTAHIFPVCQLAEGTGMAQSGKEKARGDLITLYQPERRLW